MSNVIPPRLLDTKSAALYLNMSAEYLKRARITGKSSSGSKSPKFIKMGRSIRYPLEELNAFIDSYERYENLAEAGDN